MTSSNPGRLHHLNMGRPPHPRCLGSSVVTTAGWPIIEISLSGSFSLMTFPAAYPSAPASAPVFLQSRGLSANGRSSILSLVASARSTRACSASLVAWFSRASSGVEFVAVANPHANKLPSTFWRAVARHERELIAQRTRDTLQAAKASLQAAKARGRRRQSETGRGPQARHRGQQSVCGPPCREHPARDPGNSGKWDSLASRCRPRQSWR
jgi:hypothetical protein